MGKLALAVAGDGLLWFVVADGDCWCVLATSGERWWQVEVGLAVHGWLGLVEGGAGCGWLAGRSMAGRGWQWPAAAEVDCWRRRLISTGEKSPQRFKSTAL